MFCARVRVRDDLLPTTMDLPVVATYFTEAGEPRSARWSIQLPLCLVCTCISPVKNANCKITLESNQAAPQLSDIFEDVVSLSALDVVSSSSNVLSFQYFAGMDVTVLISKSSNRYRIQSNDFHCIWLILDFLTKRCIRQHAV